MDTGNKEVPAASSDQGPAKVAPRGIVTVSLTSEDEGVTRASPADLAQRLTQLESAVKKMGYLEKDEAQAATVLIALQQGLQALTQQLQAVAGKVEGIIQNLQATPDYGLGHMFTCRKCLSKSTVSIRIKCTQCGDETEQGWWPQHR